MIKNFLFLLSLSYSLCASSMLDGEYDFKATIKEKKSHEKYNARIHLYIENYTITGDVDYYNDGCAGKLKGELLSAHTLLLKEEIKTGKELCDNGIYNFALKHKIIFKPNCYVIEDKNNSVSLTTYQFKANQTSWESLTLKDKIAEKKIDIDSLHNDIKIIQRFIRKSLKQAEQSKTYIEHNSSMISGICTKPPLDPKPKPFFNTEKKAKKYALAYCSVSFGCRIGVELGRDTLDTAAKRFLASQSCSMLVKDYISQGTLLDETMFNLLDAVSYEGCEDGGDGFLGGIIQGGSCIMSGVTRLARVEQYVNCIDYKTKEFYNSYLEWKHAPIKKEKACKTHLKILKETPIVIKKYKQEIRNIKDNIAQEKKKLKSLETKLTQIQALRRKQKTLIQTLTK